MEGGLLVGEVVEGIRIRIIGRGRRKCLFRRADRGCNSRDRRMVRLGMLDEHS